MYVKRRKEEALIRFIQEEVSHKDVLLVEGARQVGKTSLIRHTLEQINVRTLSIDLEKDSLFRTRIDECREFSEFEELLQDELDFDPSRECVLFIDEAQESLRLGAFVRYMKEEWPAVTTILTGSTLPRLFRDPVRYPVGRVQRLAVRPFSFSEFLDALGKPSLAEELLHPTKEISPTRHQNLLSLLDNYLETGGMPQVVIDFVAGRDFRRQQASILADYEQDFIRLFSEDSLAVAKGCLRSVANFVGTPSKNSTVVSEPTKKNHEEIKRIFGRLENWRIILPSDQVGPSPRASHKYHSKRYLFDTGLLRRVRETAVPCIRLSDTISSAQRQPLGGIIENQAAIELMDQYQALSGWKKTPSGFEIDFIVQENGVPYPIECKAALEIKKTHCKGLREYLEIYGISKGCTISFAPFQEILLDKGRSITNIPLYKAEMIREYIQ